MNAENVFDVHEFEPVRQSLGCGRCGQTYESPGHVRGSIGVVHGVRPGQCDTEQGSEPCPDCELGEPKCACWVTPESTWLSAASCGYGSSYEPGSQMEWNPDCPVHTMIRAVGGDTE